VATTDYHKKLSTHLLRILILFSKKIHGRPPEELIRQMLLFLMETLGEKGYLGAFFKAIKLPQNLQREHVEGQNNLLTISLTSVVIS